MDALRIKRVVALLRATHGAEARWVGGVEVCEQLGDVLVWEGRVQVFDLIDHPEAAHAYAWIVETPSGPQVMSVLGRPPIDSAGQAVRATFTGGAARTLDAV